MMLGLRKTLSREVDNAQLILFRLIYGLLLTIEAWGAILTGWVNRVFIEPKLNFPFIDFDFLHPLKGNGMIYYYVIMGFFGLMVMLGLKYRLAIISYTIMWAIVYFMQKTSYNNHYYLIMVFNFIFCFLPAHEYASLDSKQKPALLSLHCPLWSIWIFKAMILTVYLYSAVAKMYPAWLAAEPIKIWFTAKSHYWLIGSLLEKEWFQYFVAWGGILFDLLIGPALLWRNTRKVAFGLSIFFHLFNSAVFQVGVFPYLGISFAIFFFDRELIRKLFFKAKLKVDDLKQRRSSLAPILLGLLLIVQFLLPLRHWCFPGDVNWTEEGHRLSWHMMLRVKGGYVGLTVVNNDTKESESVNLDDYLSKKQQRAIASRPDMLWQFVQYLKEAYAEQGNKDISIYAKGAVSLNAAPPRPLYDSERDLAKVEWHAFESKDWLIHY